MYTIWKLRTFETWVRIESSQNWARYCNVVATALRSSDDTYPAGVGAVVPFLPPDCFSVYPSVFLFVDVWTLMVEFPQLRLLTRNTQSKYECSGQRGPRSSGWNMTNFKNTRALRFRKTTRAPHACRKHVIERMKRKSNVISHRDWKLRWVLRSSHELQLLGTYVVVYFCRSDFDFFVRFENAARCVNATR